MSNLFFTSNDYKPFSKQNSTNFPNNLYMFDKLKGKLVSLQLLAFKLMNINTTLKFISITKKYLKNA